jgi:uncharacterized RDD family membrane protein YckC
MTSTRYAYASRDYASLTARLIAGFLDLVVLIACACIFLAAGGTPLLVASDFGQVDAPEIYYVVFLAVMLAYLPFIALYFIVLWTWRGQTIGQLAMGHKVVHRDGTPVGLLGAIGRLLGYPISALPLFLGFLAAALDPERRTLHDRLAGTVVIRSS